MEYFLRKCAGFGERTDPSSFAYPEGTANYITEMTLHSRLWLALPNSTTQIASFLSLTKTEQTFSRFVAAEKDHISDDEADVYYGTRWKFCYIT